MAISARAVGSWAAVNATTQEVTLPTHATGDMLLVRVGRKHATPSSEITCGTSGWAQVGSLFDNGGGASANNGGGVQVAVFYKIATSAAEPNPTITYHATVAATPGCAVAVSYQKGAGEQFIAPVGDGGAIAAATSYTATIQSHVAAAAGDMLDAFAVTNDNTVLTVPTVAQAGLTLADVTEYPDTAGIFTTSNDISADGCYRLANSGTSSAAAVVSGTDSVADPGAAWVTRLRIQTATSATQQDPATITGAANTSGKTVEARGTGAGAGTGAAYQATGRPGKPAAATLAESTGAAYGATAKVVGNVGLAASTGAAETPTDKVTPLAVGTSATGDALDATAETVAGVINFTVEAAATGVAAAILVNAKLNASAGYAKARSA